MRSRKVLLLEGAWAKEESEYLTETLTSSRLYSALEIVAATRPIVPITRPLLASRFEEDLRLFASLERKGPNVVVLSSHGAKETRRRHRSLKHRRILSAYDGELNISVAVRNLAADNTLQRTIFVLDSCEVGGSPGSLRKASGALGVIGFSSNVDWVDSCIFVTALLMRYADEGVLHMKKVGNRHKRVYREMRRGAYKSLADALGVQASFAP